MNQTEYVKQLIEANKLAMRIIDEALPKFNWGASALDANAISLLNEGAITIRATNELILGQEKADVS
jgi:hypothetical protein